ncbi:MAG: alpha/beta hydrolase [Bacteroidota bacterium]
MIDWNDAFDNSGYIPDAQGYVERWAANAADFRTNWASEGSVETDIPYARGPRRAFDLFQPAGPSAGLMVFVHGGYWRRFDKSDWSHLAEGALRRGWSVAMPSYPLAPDARISEMTKAMAQVLHHLCDLVEGPLRLAGHSAGGHLVSRMMCAGVLDATAASRIEKITSISGLHALEPLLLTDMNDTLRLTEDEARTESPANLPPLTHIPLTAWVGAQERPEFIRQTRLIEEVWSRAGAQVDAVYDPGHHHFSVIEAMQTADSPLMKAILG